MSGFQCWAVVAQAQDSNAANSPLTPAITFNFQDYYVPDIVGLPDREANQYLQRGLLPYNLFGMQQLFRYTLPVATAPTLPWGSEMGLGDLFLVNFSVLPTFPGNVQVALGPLLVAPTASDHVLGNGKRQAGPAVAVVAPQSWGLLAGLLQHQQSFAGDEDRPDVSLLTFQPIITYNLQQGWYLRSSGIWNFDFENDNHFIPVGLGIGKVWKVDQKTTANLFIEPQYTVWEDADPGIPRQIFIGSTCSSQSANEGRAGRRATSEFVREPTFRRERPLYARFAGIKNAASQSRASDRLRNGARR